MKILRILSWLIHHKTNVYHESKHECVALGYTEYHTYRVHRVLGIPIRIFHKRFTTLGDGEDRRCRWAYDKVYNENAVIKAI